VEHVVSDGPARHDISQEGGGGGGGRAVASPSDIAAGRAPERTNLFLQRLCTAARVAAAAATTASTTSHRHRRGERPPPLFSVGDDDVRQAAVGHPATTTPTSDWVETPGKGLKEQPHSPTDEEVAQKTEKAKAAMAEAMAAKKAAVAAKKAAAKAKKENARQSKLEAKRRKQMRKFAAAQEKAESAERAAVLGNGEDHGGNIVTVELPAEAQADNDSSKEKEDKIGASRRGWSAACHTPACGNSGSRSRRVVNPAPEDQVDLLPPVAANLAGGEHVAVPAATADQACGDSSDVSGLAHAGLVEMTDDGEDAAQTPSKAIVTESPQPTNLTLATAGLFLGGQSNTARMGRALAILL
jgi:hypothetical protein